MWLPTPGAQEGCVQSKLAAYVEGLRVGDLVREEERRLWIEAQLEQAARHGHPLDCNRLWVMHTPNSVL